MVCCDCGRDREDEAFPARMGKPGYENSKRDRCFDCERTKRNGFWARRYSTAAGRAKWMLQNAAARAKARGLEFTLTQEWAQARLAAGVCEATGLPFDFSTVRVAVRAGEWAHPLAPSIERKDPAMGYTPDNCEVIVWLLNRAKANFDRDEFDRVMSAYVARRRKAE